MSDLVTDNIDRLQLSELDRPLGWRLTFRSTNDGLHHQLYANGRLADFTDTPQQRSFEVTAETTTRELAVVAVSPGHRCSDFSAELPEAIRQPGWVYRPAVGRDIGYRPGDQLAIYHDGATGTVGENPALLENIWPPSAPHWGFGVDQFGRGGFGIDGTAGAGMGVGAFGLGPFGIGADLLDIDLPLTADGTHEIELCAVSTEGQASAAANDTFEAHPPPEPPTSITATSYNPQTNQLTLQIQESS